MLLKPVSSVLMPVMDGLCLRDVYQDLTLSLHVKMNRCLKTQKIVSSVSKVAESGNRKIVATNDSRLALRMLEFRILILPNGNN